MKNRLTFLIALLVVFSGLGRADNVLGVNFCDGWATPHLAGETADGFSNWTDSIPTGGSGQANGTGLVVLGSGGLVTCDWSSPNTWPAGAEGTSDQQLYRVYLDDGENGCQVTIHGLSAWLAAEGIGAYSIRIYHSTDNGADSGFMPVDIKSGDTILQTVQASNTWTTDGGFRAYVDAIGLTADTITLDPQPKVSGYRATIAGFKIVGIAQYKQAINPDPAVGAEVQLDQVLSWEQASDVSGLGITYNLYFGSDANTLSPNYYGLAPVKTTTSDPQDFNYDPALINSTAYYWRVDAIEPNVPNPILHPGDEWQFTTVPANAFVTVDPVSQTVAAGTDVQLTVAGVNVETYQWYKDGVALTDGGSFSGSTTDTLSITNVQVAEEGLYHCDVDNSLIEPATSATAQVMTERLVGWWKLDGDLTDAVATAVTGAPTHDGVSTDPNFVGIGKDGGALEFFGDVDGLVTITDSADYFNFYPRGYTLSAWVNMPEKVNSPWGAFISKELREGTWQGFVLSHAGSGVAVHTLRASFNDLGNSADVDDDTWHLVVGTYDAANKQGKIYVDGVLLNQATSTGNPMINPNNLIFGAETADAAVSPYSGLLDDIRIWSYPLDEYAVGSLYTDFTPGVWVCVNRPALDKSGPDIDDDQVGDPDCKVDLYDLAYIAEAWLECGRTPGSYCNDM